LIASYRRFDSARCGLAKLSLPIAVAELTRAQVFGQAVSPVIKINEAAAKADITVQSLCGRYRIELKAIPGTSSPGSSATVAVNSLGLLDLLEIAVSHLLPKARYTILLSDNNQPPFRNLLPLTTFVTWPDGAGVAQAIGRLKKVVSQSGQTASEDLKRRYLILSPASNISNPVFD
jgi:hypothetical protein